LDKIFHGKRKFYEEERNQITDLPYPPPPPASKKKRGPINKRARKVEESDDEVVCKVQPPAKKVASGKKVTVEDALSDGEYH
jgi:hypothetical protein